MIFFRSTFFLLIICSSAFCEEAESVLRVGRRLNWKTSFAVPMTGPLIILGAAMLVVLTFLLYLKILRAFPVRRATILIVFRTLGLLALFLSALQPTVSHDLVVPRRTELVVMVDTSKSMNIADIGEVLLPPDPQNANVANIEMTRSDALNLSLKRTLVIDELARQYNVHLFTIDSFAAAVGQKQVAERISEGEFTDLGSSMRSAFRQVEGEIHAGVLISDGADNSIQSINAIVDELQTPLFTIGAGSTKPRQAAGIEIAVASVEYNKRIVLNERTTVRVNVYHQGFNGQLPVSLKFNQETLDSQTMSLSDNQKNNWLTLHFTPTSEGLFTYHIFITPQFGEQTVTNNTRKITIEVHQEETRVLYIAGEPSFDYKFIKKLIQEDPSLSFTGLVRFSPDRAYRQGKWTEEKGLDLAEFQIVIFSNLVKDYLTGGQLEQLRKQVEEGGTGMIILGGPNVYADGGYSDTPLGALLPVVIESEQVGYKDVDYEVVLTSEGTEHPVFRFLSETGKNLEFWGALPSSCGLNFGLRPKPAASVLAKAKTKSNTTPLILVQKYGRGRTLVLAGRYTWPWRETSAGRACFDRFWGQALRWVAAREEIKVKEGEQLRFWTDKDDYNAGDEITMKALVTDEHGKLTSTNDLLARIIAPDKSETPINLLSINELGRYSGAFIARKQGQYEVEVTATREEFLMAQARSRFTVGSTLAELDQAEMNEALLMAIASRSGGGYLPLKDIGKLPEKIQPGRRTELRRISEEVWSHPYFLVLFFALVSTEWILRKRFHMV